MLRALSTDDDSDTLWLAVFVWMCTHILGDAIVCRGLIATSLYSSKMREPMDVRVMHICYKTSDYMGI